MPGKAGLVCFVNLIRKVQVATAGSKCFTGGKMGMFSESFSLSEVKSYYEIRRCFRDTG